MAVRQTSLIMGLVGVLWVVTGSHSPPAPVGDPVGVGVLLSQVVEQHFEGCHLVLLTTAWEESLVFVPIVRSLAEEYQAGLLVDVWRLLMPLEEDSDLLQHLREGDARFPCRAVVIDLTSGRSTQEVFRFLEEVQQLYLWPETRVLVVGQVGHLHYVLNDRVFRNTANTLFFALRVHALQNLVSPLPASYWGDTGVQEPSNCTWQDSPSAKSSDTIGNCREVELYYRCLYCDQGEPIILMLDSWTLQRGFLEDQNLFPDQFQNFHGHTFRIVSMDWFPLLEFTRDSNDSGTTVTPRASLDYRSLTSISTVLNFTYVMRTPWDNQWGVSQEDGNWTGTVGTLQHHKADFSMLLSWLGSRMAVVDYSRVYVSEPLVIVTSKTGPLPQIFALVRPFPGVLWIIILLMCMLVGVIMWMLQRVRTRFLREGGGLELSTALMHAWGILLEDPPPILPINITGQMLAGWWWVFCMLITVAYRSSLIAHLSVPNKSPMIDTLEQLLSQDDWTWGMEGTYGVGWEWFKESTVPTVQRIYEHMEELTAEEHLAKVMQGQHAFLTWKYYIRSIITSRFTDSYGYTPMYTSRSEYINYGGYGWGFRKGAPFRKRIDRMKQRLLEGGLINYWMNDLILMASREERSKGFLVEYPTQENSGRVVLGLQQLQGAFYLLGLGFFIASLVFLAETLAIKFL